jgi:hypothetical protein
MIGSSGFSVFRLAAETARARGHSRPRHDQIDQIRAVHHGVKRRIGTVRYGKVGDHLPRCPQDRRLQRGKPAATSLGFAGDGADVVLAHAELLDPEAGVVGVFVAAAGQVSDLNDRQLPQPGVERAAMADVPAEPLEGAGHAGAVGQRTMQGDRPFQ